MALSGLRDEGLADRFLLTVNLSLDFIAGAKLGPKGIRINSVCPSGMPSNFMPGSKSEAGVQLYVPVFAIFSTIAYSGTTFVDGPL